MIQYQNLRSAAKPRQITIENIVLQSLENRKSIPVMNKSGLMLLATFAILKLGSGGIAAVCDFSQESRSFD
jgi:hypothetical protein